MSLERVDGPDCPRCGCQDSEVSKVGSRWGQPIERRTCTNCGQTWNAVINPKQETPPAEAPGDRRRRYLEWKQGSRSES